MSPELALLIAEQERDDRRPTLRASARCCRECDLAAGGDGTFRMELLADPLPEPAEMVIEAERAAELLGVREVGPWLRPGTIHGLTGLRHIWGIEATQYDGEGPCPACAGEAFGPYGVCLVCNASRDNPRPWPMRDRRRETMADRCGRRLAGGLEEASPDPEKVRALRRELREAVAAAGHPVHASRPRTRRRVPITGASRRPRGAPTPGK